MLWIIALGKWASRQRDVKGRGPEPMKAMLEGGAEKKGARREASRWERER
jgi:hypothetical protein